MKRLIVNVRDKSLVKGLRELCNVVYESKFMNVIGVEINEDKIPMLETHPNVLHIRESETGQFQPA